MVDGNDQTDLSTGKPRKEADIRGNVGGKGVGKLKS